MREGDQTHNLNSPTIFILAAFFVLNSSFVFAQRPPTSAINLSYLEIAFIRPGARPAAMGGAFMGAAQDETAAAINPAGLTYLKSAGASLNQRTFTRSRVAINPCCINTQKDVDQSMVAVFFPIKKFTFAYFRQIVFDSRPGRFFPQFLTKDSNLTTRQALGGLGNFPGVEFDQDVNMVNYSFALAYEISKRLSLGISVSASDLDVRMTEKAFLDPKVADGLTPRGNSTETTYSITIVEEPGDPVETSYSLGLMAKLIEEKLFFGAAINFYPTYHIDSNIFLPEYKVRTQTFAAESHRMQFNLSVPDTYGFGLYFRATSRLNLTFDILKVEYSDLLSGNDLNVAADDEFNEQTETYEDPDRQPDLTVEDATELHLGVEWLVKVQKLDFLLL